MTLDKSSGARITQPENIDGNWNTYAGLVFNTALDSAAYFNINSFTNLGYNHYVGYASVNNLEESQKSVTKSANINQRLADTGALLEVNTGAMARGYLFTPYPDVFLLKAWKTWGGEVIINSDCHDARLLTAGFSEAEALLCSLGYDHAVRLGRDTLWERFALGR